MLRGSCVRKQASPNSTHDITMDMACHTPEGDGECTYVAEDERRGEDREGAELRAVFRPALQRVPRLGPRPRIRPHPSVLRALDRAVGMRADAAPGAGRAVGALAVARPFGWVARRAERRDRLARPHPGVADLEHIHVRVAAGRRQVLTHARCIAVSFKTTQTMLAKLAGQPHIVGEKRLGVELREEAAGADRRGPERILVVAVPAPQNNVCGSAR